MALMFVATNVSAIDTKAKFTSNCVARAISMMAGLPYVQVAKDLTNIMKNHKIPGSVTSGIPTYHHRIQEYMRDQGFRKVKLDKPTHLDDLPPGRMIAKVHGHWTSIKGGRILDTFDPRTKGDKGLALECYLFEGYTGLSR